MILKAELGMQRPERVQNQRVRTCLVPEDGVTPAGPESRTSDHREFLGLETLPCWVLGFLGISDFFSPNLSFLEWECLLHAYPATAF